MSSRDGRFSTGDRDFSRARWTPGGSFADTTAVSAGGNAVFVPVGGSAIAHPIGDCRGGAYTGVLSEPLGYPGTGCGVAYADVSWSWEHRERQSMFLNLDHPLGDGMDVYVDARYAWGDTELPRYALSVDRSSFTPSESVRQQLLQDPEIDSVPETLTAFHRCGSARGFGADRRAKYLIVRELQGSDFSATDRVLILPIVSRLNSKGAARMADQESLRRLTEDDYGPRSSSYLREGYKDDNFELTNVMVGEIRAIGSVKVNKFFPPLDGEFHLSATMAVIWVSQLATIFSFCDNDLLRKDREIYLPRFIDEVPQTHR